MSSRLYDYIITVDSVSQFREGNNLIGSSSGSYGLITKIDSESNTIKVKMNNVHQEFEVGESVYSSHSPILRGYSHNSFTVDSDNQTVFTLQGGVIPTYLEGYSGAVGNGDVRELNVYVDGVYKHPTDWFYDIDTTTINFYEYSAPKEGLLVVRRDQGNLASESFTASNLSIGNTLTTSSSTISSIANSSFIRSLNEFTQPPLVRLVSIYYPGEWYPPLQSGNPGGSGEGYAWPSTFPLRIAEVVGDIHSDISYNVSHDGDTYIPYPMEVDGIATSSDGTIDSVTIRISNYDNLITSLVEDPYLVGNVTSNSASGIVNGELVVGLDPETVVGNIHYNQDTVDSYYGKTNAAWIYSQAQAREETWKALKYDTRDLLGAVVEIKSTFADHLRYWPEYSTISFIDSTVVTVVNSAPYRVGDIVTTGDTSSTITINSISGNDLTLSDTLSGVSVNDRLLILNSNYDPDSYIKDVFKITELSALNEQAAEFTLTNWLQYFKLNLPKRKYYKNTCQWQYKGDECQYPGPNGGDIPGTYPTLQANTVPITITNEEGASAEEDECSKSFLACKLRNNTVHFGGFIGTGRSIAR
jgi:phage-related protein